eukprot:CAMPEP_0167792548 /NCGR_PEP_ID=MMETSP0111_2-20121227/12624_1 /TAXON_ID=91324 /ORGANISM="Lotharella globosa, Strain CCCM811" /LENGTH=252 /DNA_ID=CAMNT_0007685483 /DNA_START=17 /DNA_END=775 /DNA_ORIENTATION=+
MSTAAQGTPGGDQGCLGSCCDSLKNLDPATLSYVMKIINIINAILLMFTGIWVFIGGQSALNVLLVLASLYVICFSLILLIWELKLEMCNICFLRNMGFMFSWRGRLLFFLFVGTLAFGLGTVGIIIGVFTFVNATWNVFVVCFHPEYFERLRETAEKELRGAMVSEAAKYAAQHADNIGDNALEAVENGDKDAKGWEGEAATEDTSPKPAPAAPADAGGLPTGWEQRTDEHSGTPYWVNAATGEQSWEKPH